MVIAVSRFFRTKWFNDNIIYSGLHIFQCNDQFVSEVCMVKAVSKFFSLGWKVLWQLIPRFLVTSIFECLNIAWPINWDTDYFKKDLWLYMNIVPIYRMHGVSKSSYPGQSNLQVLSKNSSSEGNSEKLGVNRLVQGNSQQLRKSISQSNPDYIMY